MSSYSFHRCSNVIILTTSNITGAIDLAFVDRYDSYLILHESNFLDFADRMRALTDFVLSF